MILRDGPNPGAILIYHTSKASLLHSTVEHLGTTSSFTNYGTNYLCIYLLHS